MLDRADTAAKGAKLVLGVGQVTKSYPLYV